nr:non-ribosomal peptide synthetase [Acidobacteriota bacterium]
HLAVWEAGGIVVFIDPAWPSDRIEYVLNDSDAVAVLAETDTLSSVPDTGRRLLMLDDAIQDAPPLGNIPLHPHNTAYLIYTSGTTGRPKGVAVSHGALAAHCHVVAERYSLTSNDTVMQFADLGFDASLEQWLPALAKTNGRVAVRGNKPWSTEDLLSKLQQYHISVANLPPALWRELVEAMPEETDLPDLRLMILGGDTLPAAMLPQWWQKTSGKIELLNAYGPTETVITATTQSVAQGVLPARIPIGRQLPNRSIYVLDAFGKPVPPGFPGQLALGGNLLAGGYWGRPGQTAEVFVPDPYAEAKGARLYLTGDRVRLLPDYSLDYLGRLDRQIKLRGFRIELGEIEAALNQSPLISRSAVFVRKDSLTACLTLGEQARGDLETDLKNHLQRKLPAYMIPASFVVLKNIPLTAGGKIDRRALEALAAEAEMRRRSRENFRPPASHWEQTIAETWREVLSLERVGVDDNFFELGGHSLLLVKLHRLLRERLQTDLELVDLMANPTVAAQARLVAPPSLTETKPKIDHGARRRDAAKKKKDQWKKRRSRR